MGPQAPPSPPDAPSQPVLWLLLPSWALRRATRGRSPLSPHFLTQKRGKVIALVSSLPKGENTTGMWALESFQSMCAPWQNGSPDICTSCLAVVVMVVAIASSPWVPLCPSSLVVGRIPDARHTCPVPFGFAFTVSLCRLQLRPQHAPALPFPKGLSHFAFPRLLSPGVHLAGLRLLSDLS